MATMSDLDELGLDLEPAIQAAARVLFKTKMHAEGAGHAATDPRWEAPWNDREPWLRQATAVVAAVAPLIKEQLAVASRAEGWAADVAALQALGYEPALWAADRLEALAAAPDAQTTGGNDG